MSYLFLLFERQLRRIELYFPLSHGVPRVDDRRVLSGIILSSATVYAGVTLPRRMDSTTRCVTGFIRWSRLGVFERIFEALAVRGGKPDRIMIDATHLKAHRTAASLLKKGSSAPYRADQGRPELRGSLGQRLTRRWRRLGGRWDSPPR